MKWLHLFHTFDPAKWQQISCTPVVRSLYVDNAKGRETVPLGNEHVFSNTCQECGDLIFRRVTDIDW